MYEQLVIIGGGNMGLAIAKSLLNNPKFDVELQIIEPVLTRREVLAKQLSCAVIEKLTIKPKQALLLAVKPQVAEQVLKTFTTDATHLLVSIMAGISLKFLRQHHPNCQMVRVMPNTPSAIGEGVSAYYADVDPTALQFVENLLNSFGCTVKVNQEQMLDAATAISGSGPAYVFYFAEIMMEQAQKWGFSAADARTLVLNTLFGSAKLMLNSNYDPAALRTQVTSKQGTTERALAAFEQHGFKQALQAGCESAFLRAQELAEL